MKRVFFVFLLVGGMLWASVPHEQVWSPPVVEELTGGQHPDFSQKEIKYILEQACPHFCLNYGEMRSGYARGMVSISKIAPKTARVELSGDLLVAAAGGASVLITITEGL